jgi:hypothetical protein
VIVAVMLHEQFDANQEEAWDMPLRFMELLPSF